MRLMRTFVVVAVMATAGWMPTCAAERVDLLLVLAADISRSVDEGKFQFQRSGYAAAFSNPRVTEAIRGGPSRRIAVEFLEWSGPLSQKIVIDWTLIGDVETAHQFSDRIVEAPRAFANSTSISAGIDFAVTQLDRAPYEAHRRVIDVSGDGDNNAGHNVAATRDEAIAKGVTINGLVILTELSSLSYSTHTNPPGGLANYYRRNVIGGPGAFVVVAENFNSFGYAIIKKLIAEIAQPVPHHRASQGQQSIPNLEDALDSDIRNRHHVLAYQAEYRDWCSCRNHYRGSVNWSIDDEIGPQQSNRRLFRFKRNCF